MAALARATLAKGSKADAEILYRRALDLSQKAYGPKDERTRKTARELATLLRQNGKATEAAALDRTFNAPAGR